MTKAADDVLAERKRQISEYEWTAKHDDDYANNELALAAALYALPQDHRETVCDTGDTILTLLWPWGWEWWKPGTRRRDLVKAGALILAEIERIDRAAIRNQE